VLENRKTEIRSRIKFQNRQQSGRETLKERRKRSEEAREKKKRQVQTRDLPLQSKYRRGESFLPEKGEPSAGEKARERGRGVRKG